MEGGNIACIATAAGRVPRASQWTRDTLSVKADALLVPTTNCNRGANTRSALTI